MEPVFCRDECSEPYIFVVGENSTDTSSHELAVQREFVDWLSPRATVVPKY